MCICNVKDPHDDIHTERYYYGVTKTNEWTILRVLIIWDCLYRTTYSTNCIQFPYLYAISSNVGLSTFRMKKINFAPTTTTTTIICHDEYSVYVYLYVCTIILFQMLIQLVLSINPFSFGNTREMLRNKKKWWLLNLWHTNFKIHTLNDHKISGQITSTKNSMFNPFFITVYGT